MTRPFDLITIGRSSIDLYANEIGASFPEIKSFGAFVGGSPTNIAVGAGRLGLDTALVTAVGADPVGDFVLSFLEREGVSTAFIPRKKGRRTSAVLLGIQPPDRFPLVFYRDNCADIELSIDDVEAVPLDRARMLLVTGTGLSREPSRSATMAALERAHAAGVQTLLDLDFRLDQWHDPRAYGIAVRSVLPWTDVAIGTEEEVKMAASAGEARIEGSAVSSPEVSGDLDRAITRLLAAGLPTLALKRGARGSTVHTADGRRLEAGPFPVEVVNVLGAGDAYAAGFVYGLSKGWTLDRAARMGNAVGAILVTKQGCANFMPTEAEVLSFIAANGGF